MSSGAISLLTERKRSVIVVDVQSEIAPSIGGRIRQARREASLTQEQLATSLGVHRKTVERWERDGGEPRSGFITSLADALSVSSAWLLGEEAAA